MQKEISEEKRIEWEIKIIDQKKSGLSITDWCRKHQIGKGTYYYWKNRLNPKPEITRDSFTEIPVLDQGSRISMEYKGMLIVIEKAFDPLTLRSCVAALRGL
jgi:hypothetical protein